MKLMTVTNFATHVGKTKQWAYQLIWRGLLPTQEIDGKTFVDIERYNISKRNKLNSNKL